jgi:hypothetical protein
VIPGWRGVVMQRVAMGRFMAISGLEIKGLRHSFGRLHTIRA